MLNRRRWSPPEFDRRDYITPEYEGLQRELHMRPQGYGGKGFKWADTVIAIARHFDAFSVLDYGCGKGSLAHKLATRNLDWLRVAEYDPAVEGKSAMPLFADLVVITDVLEHVEPECLAAVLHHLHKLARKAVLFVVALDPANKTLADGRNAHLILQPREWWAERVVEAGFRLAVWEDWPMPTQFNAHPDKQLKRWVAVGVPC